MTAPEDDELDVDLVLPESVYLQDDMCWVGDPDALHHDSEAEGVLAVLYRGGGLWYLDGETRQWFSVDKDGAKKAKPVHLRPAN